MNKTNHKKKKWSKPRLYDLSTGDTLSKPGSSSGQEMCTFSILMGMLTFPGGPYSCPSTDPTRGALTNSAGPS